MKYGRKPKLTESTVRDLTDALGIGATVEIACAYAGVSTSSYYRWLGIGAAALEKFEADSNAELSDEEERYLRFYDEIEKTKAYAAIGWLNVVGKAAAQDAAYALRLLRMRYPGQFDEVQKHEVDLDGGIQLVGIDPDAEDGD